MMGRNHVRLAALIGLGAGVVAGLPPASLALFTVQTAGFGVLPDIDHPDSGIAHSMGPVTRGLARLINRMSGGHRKGTHSWFGAACFTYLGFAATALHTGSWATPLIGLGIAAGLLAMGWLTALRVGGGRRPRPAFKRRWHGWAALSGLVSIGAGLTFAGTQPWGRFVGGFLVAFFVALCLAALLKAWKLARRALDRLPSGLVDECLPYAAALALVLSGVAEVELTPYAMALGVVAHILGDLPTTQGCPLGWPWTLKSVGPPFRFDVNSPTETVIGRVMAVVLVAAGAACFVVVPIVMNAAF